MVIADLVKFGYGSIIDQMAIDEMFAHSIEAKNNADLRQYQSLGIDNDKYPFVYPFGH